MQLVQPLELRAYRRIASTTSGRINEPVRTCNTAAPLMIGTYSLKKRKKKIRGFPEKITRRPAAACDSGACIRKPHCFRSMFGESIGTSWTLKHTISSAVIAGRATVTPYPSRGGSVLGCHESNTFNPTLTPLQTSAFSSRYSSMVADNRELFRHTQRSENADVSHRPCVSRGGKKKKTHPADRGRSGSKGTVRPTAHHLAPAVLKRNRRLPRPHWPFLPSTSRTQTTKSFAGPQTDRREIHLSSRTTSAYSRARDSPLNTTRASHLSTESHLDTSSAPTRPASILARTIRRQIRPCAS
jgi:hypothetical protein